MKTKPHYVLFALVCLGIFVTYGAATAKKVGKYGIGRPFYGPWERWVYIAFTTTFTLYAIYLFINSFRASRHREIRTAHSFPLSWPACVLRTISGEGGAMITVETDFDIDDDDEIVINVVIELDGDKARAMEDIVISNGYICNSVVEQINKKGRWSGVMYIYNKSRLREVGDREICITIRASGRVVSLPGDMRLLEVP